MTLSLENITFQYESSPGPLWNPVRVSFMTGWTGVMGANGTGKTTLLCLATGHLTPLSGTLIGAGSSVYCPQRTDDPPEQFREFMMAADGEAWHWRGLLGLKPDWPDRWDTLSHGERKRAQIAVALWSNPEVLAIDEPTNHLDRKARNQIIQALHEFRGIGLIVSHDRDLLDELCQRMVVVDPPDVVLIPGGYTEAAATYQARLSEMETTRTRAKLEVERLEKEFKKREAKSRKYAKGFSKKNLDRHDSDGRARIDGARLTGRDAKAGQLSNQIKSRMNQALDTLEKARVKKEYKSHFWMETEQYPGDRLSIIPPGRIPMGENLYLEVPERILTPTDRVAITGPNGAGKTTLLRYILEHLSIPLERVVYLPQEITAAESSEILESIRTLSETDRGRVMTIVSCLGSRPDRLLVSETPSPGEVRKLLLALGISRQPWLIILDEPTNHLDLPTVELLEAALKESPCALIVVSHDERFLSAVTNQRWEL